METNSSGTSTHNAGGMQVVPAVNIAVEPDNFQGMNQNVSDERLVLVGDSVPRHLLGSLTYYPESVVRHGRFGQVSKVFSPYIGAAAVKTLRPNINITTTQQDQCEREFLNIYHLNHHPNIVGLYGYVYANLNDRNPMGILMEYMIGGTLQDYIHLKGPNITEQEKNTWAKQIALGLNFIHGQNMMHRDLKPDNILLSQSCLTAKIADFGLARRLSPSSNHTVNIGNPVYAAPEVYMEEGIGTARYTEAADVWSYAMVLYFIYYLRHPYNPETLKKKIAPLVRVRVWQGLETRPDMLMRPALNGYEVDTIITECWKTDPTQRCTMGTVVKFFHSDKGVAMFPSLMV